MPGHKGPRDAGVRVRSLSHLNKQRPLEKTVWWSLPAGPWPLPDRVPSPVKWGKSALSPSCRGLPKEGARVPYRSAGMGSHICSHKVSLSVVPGSVPSDCSSCPKVSCSLKPHPTIARNVLSLLFG